MIFVLEQSNHPRLIGITPWELQELPGTSGNYRKLCDTYMQQREIGVGGTHFLFSTKIAFQV